MKEALAGLLIALVIGIAMFAVLYSATKNWERWEKEDDKACAKIAELADTNQWQRVDTVCLINKDGKIERVNI